MKEGITETKKEGDNSHCAEVKEETLTKTESSQEEIEPEGEGSNRSKVRTKMATLANLKQVCPELQLEQSTNNEKMWQNFIDNFESVLAFEGIEDDRKKRGALLAVAGQEVRDIFKTLEEEEAKTYETAKKALDEYFKGKKT